MLPWPRPQGSSITCATGSARRQKNPGEIRELDAAAIFYGKAHARKRTQKRAAVVPGAYGQGAAAAQGKPQAHRSRHRSAGRTYRLPAKPDFETLFCRQNASSCASQERPRFRRGHAGMDRRLPKKRGSSPSVQLRRPKDAGAVPPPSTGSCGLRWSDSRPVASKRQCALVAGIPNAGKSTLINRLSEAGAVGNKPGVTRGSSGSRQGRTWNCWIRRGLLWPRLGDREVACTSPMSSRSRRSPNRKRWRPDC